MVNVDELEKILSIFPKSIGKETNVPKVPGSSELERWCHSRIYLKSLFARKQNHKMTTINNKVNNFESMTILFTFYNLS